MQAMRRTTGRRSRRNVLGDLGTAFGASALTACGAAAGSRQPGPEQEVTQPVMLDFWVNWFGPSREPAYKVLNDAFAAENPRFTVNVPSNVNVEKLIASVVAGTPPDAATIRGSGQALAIRSAIQPLDDRIAKARLFKKSDYVEAQWEQYAWKGKLYAVPSMENGARGALVYNKRLFAEAGLNPDQPPKTVDELLKAHERLTKEEGGQLKQLGFDPWDAMST
jgi:multiple sugar transport system substrate-binding protein